MLWVLLFIHLLSIATATVSVESNFVRGWLRSSTGTYSMFYLQSSTTERISICIRIKTIFVHFLKVGIPIAQAIIVIEVPKFLLYPNYKTGVVRFLFLDAVRNKALCCNLRISSLHILFIYNSYVNFCSSNWCVVFCRGSRLFIHFLHRAGYRNKT